MSYVAIAAACVLIGVFIGIYISADLSGTFVAVVRATGDKIVAKVKGLFAAIRSKVRL